MTAQNCASKDKDKDAGFSLLTHAAVIHSHRRLLDPKEISQLHTVNVFDFDQTLFRSPTPNAAIWDPYFLSKVIAWDECGPGWWLTRGSLDLGPEAEASGWEGYWNEDLQVPVVKESIKDPGCLTILLTGRNGPLYSDILLRMKEVQDDNDDDSDNDKDDEETYIKLHTFSTKREFLYNVLLEYPSVRTMHAWDDRLGQIAQFRQAGEKWIEQGMLDAFEVTHVDIPLRLLDPEDEIRIVRGMVEVHNAQVKLEEAAAAAAASIVEGGEKGRGKMKFLVSGVGERPRIRPELAHVKDMWEPYWEYKPERRTMIELVDVVKYTGVEFSETTQDWLRRVALGGCGGGDGGGDGHQEQGGLDAWAIQPPVALQDTDLSKWTPSREFYVFLCARKANFEYRQKLGGIGATVFVLVEGVGQVEGRAWALKVRGVHSRSLAQGYQVLAPDGQIYPSSATYLKAHPVRRFGNVVMKKHGSKPYITMAFDRLQGGRATDASRITHWEPLDLSLGPSSTTAITNLATTPGGLRAGQKIVLVGTIQEKVVIGSKALKFGHLATVPRAEIQIPALVKNYMAEKKLDITGHELGETLKRIEAEMSRLSVANTQSNHDQIFEIVLRICGELQQSRPEA
ncbi:hypothetical protein BGZ95_009956 [Linnemannia exigua]|uniref:Swiss Army Knife RNA repair protein HAD domain-containing protein n=1 Tax=Linnemannia exigua TaxID=604196 RepID=A0AAD4DCL9_9FUNG|nr:hypothetical protein BGZ95_009956 [Linnemannia exigua]